MPSPEMSDERASVTPGELVWLTGMVWMAWRVLRQSRKTQRMEVEKQGAYSSRPH